MNEIIKPLYEIVSALKDSKILWINIVLALVTFLAVLVALFSERIRKFWNRAILDMEINLVPPDCHQISLTNSHTGKFAGQSIYIRIKVIHKKGAAGENIEIMPVNFFRVKSNGKLEKLKHFLPISLVWSHFQPHTNIVRVPVNLFRHCDFGHFIKDPNNPDKALLILDTMVQPNPVAGGEVPNIIKHGKYQFELLLSGDNVKSVKKSWRLEFDKWSEDEEKMLSKNIKIKEI